ncbi:hypothetical protein [Pseudomonas phage LUZ7]|uniref:Uncharacterized protein n=1 Tax=Pseudomonas phage LUZ7 TaxID=655097 RepID=C8ZKA4_9CAUD|nr:hypothetical protein PP-LUZ7_gp005 [Pseudomonas phage LUZ7]CAZ66146.1 hypothetical protein [Pseudomonas phage LUZ7]
MDTKLLKEAIHAGMYMALTMNTPHSMCVRVAWQVECEVLTTAHQKEFRKWVYKILGNYCYVTDYLRSCHPHYLQWKARNMWCNFYVWAYFDLCKEQNHEDHS